MIYLCTCTKELTSFYKQHLSLKKEVTHHIFPIFKNDHYILIQSGDDPIHQAMAVTYLLDHFPIQSSDYLISLSKGVQLNNELPIDIPYWINKIYHVDEDTSYYPDLLIKSPFQEGSVISSSNYLDQADSSYDFYSPNAAGFFESALSYCSLDQIILLQLLEPSSYPKVLDFLSSLAKMDQAVHPITYTDEEITLTHLLCERLYLSESQQQQLKHYLYFEKLKQPNLEELLQTFIHTYKITDCNSKKEGKKYLEQLFKLIRER